MFITNTSEAAARVQKVEINLKDKKNIQQKINCLSFRISFFNWPPFGHWGGGGRTEGGGRRALT